MVRHGGDGAQRLGRLSVGLDLTAGVGVDAGEVLVVTFARLEGTILRVVGGVVGTSDTVVDMLAEVSGVGASRVASLETENAAAHEVMPLDDLLVTVVVAVRPSGGVEEATKGVTTEISAVRVKFPSRVIGGEVDLGLVDKTDDLDVVWGPHELNTLESTSGDKAGPMTRFGTPGDFLPFRQGGGTGGRCPEAEI